MDFAYFWVVLCTAAFLVVAGISVALLLAPRSNNPQKREAYECGIPTRGTSWMQFKVGYYLFAILYVMFDVGTVFLFPWGTVVKEMGTPGFLGAVFFLSILTLGLAYAWKKGALKWK